MVSSTTTRVSIVFISATIKIAAGDSHTLAVHNDGTVWGWGYNLYGQIGDGTQIKRLTPVQVTGLSDVTAVAAGEGHSLALKKDGTVWAWGANTSGQLGDGSLRGSYIPIRIATLSGIIAIAANFESSYALKNDGTVWQWGIYGDGKGTNTVKLSPTQRIGLSGIIALSSGIALKSDSTVWYWSTYNNPTQLPSISGIIALAQNALCVVKSDNTLWCWMTTTQPPTQVQGLTDIKAATGGHGFTLALKNDGTVWGWGLNAAGQLGDGTIITSGAS